MQEKNQSRGSLGIGASKPQGESAQSCFFSALFLAKTFAEVLFSAKICCTRTFDPSISLQDLFWQFFTLTTPLNICRPYICSEPVCFVSLLHKTQTHLAQAGPWPSWPRTSARGGSLGVWTFRHLFYDKRNKHKYYRTIPHQLRGNTDIIYLSTTWPKFWEQTFYANKVGSNFHNICKYNQKLLILRNMRITDCTLLMRGTKRPFRCLDLISYKLGSHVQFYIHCDKLGNSMGLKREGGITLDFIF